MLLTWLLLGGDLIDSVPGSIVTVIALAVLSVTCVVGLGDRPWIGLGITWLSAVLWLWAGAALLGSHLNRPESLLSHLERATPVLPQGTTGDVVIVVFDEFPNLPFASENLGIDIKAFESQLGEFGFQVLADMPANFSFTELSIPSFLDLHLLESEGDRTTESTRGDLLTVLGGDNETVRAFRRAGYRITVVESGWSGLRCGHLVDRCVPRRFYDEVTASIMSRSLLGPSLTSLFGSPFTVGAAR
ncbi:MAG: hypothetical protein WB239_17165, partial [Acidimicrobiia bacterium]